MSFGKGALMAALAGASRPVCLEHAKGPVHGIAAGPGLTAGRGTMLWVPGPSADVRSIGLSASEQ
jgi:hypothetical protein